MSNNDKKRKIQFEDDFNSKKVKEELNEETRKQIDKVNAIKNKLYNEIYENCKRNNVLRDEINKLDKELNKICPHKWVRDYDQYSCGRTPKICEYCGL